MPRFDIGKLDRLENCLMPDLEDRYRRHFLKSDATQAIVGMSLILLIQVIYMLSLNAYRAGTITPSRVALLIFTVVIVVLLRRIKDPGMYDWIVFTWAVILTLVDVISQLVNQVAAERSFYIDMIIIFTLYIIIPNRLAFRLGSALLLTAAGISILLVLGTHMSLAETIAWYSSYITGNLAGAFMSIRMYHQRRSEFNALENEQSLRNQVALMAETDGLTGMYNRRKFLELAEKEVALYRRYHTHVTLLFVDLDHFKIVNDTYGHQAGDAVLCYFADMVRKLLRTVDVVGRLGGEEFGILLVETPLDNAAVVAERIRDTVANSPIQFNGNRIEVTVSIGISEMSGEDCTLDAVISHADGALYRAKNAGRNRVETG